MGPGEFNVGGNKHPIQGRVEILLVSSCYWDKLQPDEPLGSCADFTFILVSTA